MLYSLVNLYSRQLPHLPLYTGSKEHQGLLWLAEVQDLYVTPLYSNGILQHLPDVVFWGQTVGNVVVSAAIKEKDSTLDIMTI